MPELDRKALKEAKSLGEKMFDALHYDSRTKGALWSSVPDRSRDYYEIAGMAFAASLSHDETANAAIASLRARAEASEQREAGLREALNRARDVLGQDWARSSGPSAAAVDAHRIIDAALTTKSGEASQ